MEPPERLPQHQPAPEGRQETVPTILTTPETAPTLTTELPSSRIWRLSVEQYHEMLRTGILQEDDPVELIDGLLVQRTRKSPRHAVARTLLMKTLHGVLPAGWIFRIQSALHFADSMPEPDVAIVRGVRRNYADHHPTNRDCALVIEVADDSLEIDRGIKWRTYARHSIAEYWIVNLPDEQIDVYSEPSGLVARPGYRAMQTFRAGESIPLNLDGVEVALIPVTAVLP